MRRAYGAVYLHSVVSTFLPLVVILKSLQKFLVISTVARGYISADEVNSARTLTRRNTFDARPVESIIGWTPLKFAFVKEIMDEANISNRNDAAGFYHKKNNFKLIN
jgi:hypothetical protein